MEKLTRNKKNFEKALQSLEALQKEEYSVILRDATLQRFEYTVELFWKTLKTWLLIREGVDCASPKKCIREAVSNGFLSNPEAETALQMIDDRNLLSHSYLEEIANKIYKQHSRYAALMRKVLNRLANETGAG